MTSLSQNMEDSSKVFVVLEFGTFCRICLDSNGILVDIFEVNEKLPLVDQMACLFDFTVKPDDNLSTKICHKCLFKIEQFYEFKQQVVESQKTLSTKILNNEDTLQKCLEAKTSKSILEKNINSENERNTLNSQFELNEKRQELVDQEANRRINRNITEVQSNKVITGYPTTVEAFKNNCCLVCFEKFTDRPSVESHVDNHLNETGLVSYFNVRERNVPCNVCNTVFSYRFNYVEHLREHLNIKPYVCIYNECRKEFYNNPSLRYHLEQHAEKAFKCDKCPLGFKRKSNLKSHQIIHEDEGFVFRCQRCGILCKNRNSLRTHIKKHVTTPKYTCDACPKRFFNQSELSRHSFSHANQKQFQCDICGREYYTKSTLLRHKRNRCHNKN